MEDFVENITRGNPGSVKAVLASVVLALAVYQLILAAIGYRKLPIIDAEPAFFTHRASGDADRRAGRHRRARCAWPCSASRTTTCCTAARDRRAGRARGQGRGLAHRASAARFLPYLGVTLFALLAVTWFTVTPDFLAGED